MYSIFKGGHYNFETSAYEDGPSFSELVIELL